MLLMIMLSGLSMASQAFDSIPNAQHTGYDKTEAAC